MENLDKKSPSFQFYAQDFLTGVIYLTNEEIGIYIKMLAKQWTDGKIPKKRLGFLVGIDWNMFSDELKSKFKDEGEYLVNTRLEKERKKKERFLNKQSTNGKKGGRPPKKEVNIEPKLNPNETHQQSQIKPLEDEDENMLKGGVGENEKTEVLDNYKIELSKEGMTTWAEGIYMQFKIKPKNLGFLIEDFISHLKCLPKDPPPNLQEFKSHFYNWCNRVTTEGKLDKYIKNPPKQAGAL